MMDRRTLTDRLKGLLGALGLGVCSIVAAESPMHVDDAGSLDRGQFKVESIVQKVGKQTEYSGAVGVGVGGGLEIEASRMLGRDRALSPHDDLSASSLAFKWVPYQSETAWSFGTRLEFGRLASASGIDPSRAIERSGLLLGLASYRFNEHSAAHLNFGGTRIRADSSNSFARVWGVGAELGIFRQTQLTAEWYGQTGEGPLGALGLRYRLLPSVKLSAAAGRGAETTLYQVGVSLEY
jgi:hypothetical protein